MNADLASNHAVYAVDAFRSRGRLQYEPASASRTEFQRDRDRIVHSTAFRRLAHKSQVFVPHEGDHYRTRLTHTIEVAQIARSLARALRLDEDLSEALALAHDLGHTPFGHTGEDTLDACMGPYGGFDHNAQALRIVTRLERRYAEFDGLNLTWECLEGLVKHNGPLISPSGALLDRYSKRGVPRAILDLDARRSLELSAYASAEAQAAAISDDIAYDAHDLDDGLRAGLFDLDSLAGVPFLRSLIDEVTIRHPRLERARTIHELMRRVITRFVEDVIAESRRRISEASPASAEEVRAQGRPLVGFSADVSEAELSIKNFLYSRMYRHPKVVRVRQRADGILRDLFERFLAEPTSMPAEWVRFVSIDGRGAPITQTRRARVAADYIAGMTDRYALAEHRRLFGETPELR